MAKQVYLYQLKIVHITNYTDTTQASNKSIIFSKNPEIEQHVLQPMA